MQKLSACRKRLSEIQRRRSTSSWCMIAICPVGPPKLMKPSFSQKRNACAKLTPTQASCFFPTLDLQLARRDRVLEVVGVERVDALLARLRLRVHEEAHRRPARAGQLDVVRFVVREPVHLPGAEELG